MNVHFLRLALVLGLVSAVGPFAIDMYLPALPSIGESLEASPAAVQMTLMAFFVTLGLFQLVYGPLSDIFGRMAPLYFGLGLFGIGSVGCALAPNVDLLIVFRVVQAVGACAGMVVPRAIVRDLHTGADAARLMSLLMLVFSVSPILAPLAGSMVIAQAGWRSVFWVVAGVSVLALVLMATQLKETRSPEARALSSWSGALSGYRRLLGDRPFLGLTFVGAFGIGAFFVYLANSSYVMIRHYGLSPMQYGMVFGVNAASFFGAAQLNGWLASKYGLARGVRFGVAGFAASMVALAAATALGLDRLEVLLGLLFVGFGFLGLVTPTTSVLALEEQGAIAGTASALMGALHMVIGAGVMALSGIFANGTPLPMVMGIALCAITAFGLAQISLRRYGATADRPVVDLESQLAEKSSE